MTVKNEGSNDSDHFHDSEEEEGVVGGGGGGQTLSFFSSLVLSVSNAVSENSLSVCVCVWVGVVR